MRCDARIDSDDSRADGLRRLHTFGWGRTENGCGGVLSAIRSYTFVYAKLGHLCAFNTHCKDVDVNTIMVGAIINTPFIDTFFC